MEWIRFLLFFFRQDKQDYQDFFACGEGPFGRRPHYPNDPVDPVQFFYLRSESIPLFLSKAIVSHLIRLAVLSGQAVLILKIKR